FCAGQDDRLRRLHAHDLCPGQLRRRRRPHPTHKHPLRRLRLHDRGPLQRPCRHQRLHHQPLHPDPSDRRHRAPGGLGHAELRHDHPLRLRRQHHLLRHHDRARRRLDHRLRRLHHRPLAQLRLRLRRQHPLQLEQEGHRRRARRCRRRPARRRPRPRRLASPRPPQDRRRRSHEQPRRFHQAGEEGRRPPVPEYPRPVPQPWRESEHGVEFL
ncbi:hypothetical protein LTR28_002021, partial [Elasticomyces elasticus]